MSSSHNDVKAPSARRGGGANGRPPVSRRQFGDKSSVIKHFGNIKTAAAGGGLSDGGWVAAHSPLLPPY